MKLKRFGGFSLMEMMVVLLIVAIVMAASAPMVSRRMIRDAASGDGNCLWEEEGNKLYPTEFKDKHVLMGTNTVPEEEDAINKATLFIDRRNNTDHIVLQNGNSHTATIKAVNNSIAFIPGGGALNNNQEQCVLIGGLGEANNVTSVGYLAGAEADHATAVGNYAKALGAYSVSIGSGEADETNPTNPFAVGTNAIAIGHHSRAGENSVALGHNADARGSAENAYTGSVAIGNDVIVGGSNEIALGNVNHTVKIRGDLIVEGNVTLAQNANKTINLRSNDYFGQLIDDSYQVNDTSNKKNIYIFNGTTSDRRLKDVGEVFKGGLEELKKLDLYNYTFKNDKNKSPRVGVMAQDLQKIFPDAVITGEDGFLRIRMEDMFFAVINAVKELDSKIAQITEQVKANLDLTAKLQEKIDSQEKEIIELKEQNAEFEKRLAKLEKKARKDKSVED